jgi:hypothetical protein
VRLRDAVCESQSLARHATAALESLNYGIANLLLRETKTPPWRSQGGALVCFA